MGVVFGLVSGADMLYACMSLRSRSHYFKMGASSSSSSSAPEAASSSEMSTGVGGVGVVTGLAAGVAFTATSGAAAWAGVVVGGGGDPADADARAGVVIPGGGELFPGAPGGAARPGAAWVGALLPGAGVRNAEPPGVPGDAGVDGATSCNSYVYIYNDAFGSI
jgi:hypothetical protein